MKTQQMSLNWKKTLVKNKQVILLRRIILNSLLTLIFWPNCFSSFLCVGAMGGLPCVHSENLFLWRVMFLRDSHSPALHSWQNLWGLWFLSFLEPQHLRWWPCSDSQHLMSLLGREVGSHSWMPTTSLITSLYHRNGWSPDTREERRGWVSRLRFSPGWRQVAFDPLFRGCSQLLQMRLLSPKHCLGQSVPLS